MFCVVCCRLYPHVKEALEPLRSKGYLTTFSPRTGKMSQGPILVVGTGNTPLHLVAGEEDERFVFFDAPLHDIGNQTYSSEISPLASTNWKQTIGWKGIEPLPVSLKSKIQDLIDEVSMLQYFS